MGLGVGITIGAIAVVAFLRQHRKLAVWERESQITVLPVWTDDPINDRCEIFVSRHHPEEEEKFKMGGQVKMSTKKADKAVSSA